METYKRICATRSYQPMTGLPLTSVRALFELVMSYAKGLYCSTVLDTRYELFRWSVVVEQIRAQNSSSGVSDRVGVGSSPGLDTCVLKPLCPYDI